MANELEHSPVIDMQIDFLKLAEKSWVNYGALTIEDLLRIVHEAAALGRAEGLEEAAKTAEDAHKTINYVGPTSIIGAGIARAIRALKEKVDG